MNFKLTTLILTVFQISCNMGFQKPIDKKEIYKVGIAVGEPIVKNIDENGGVIDVDINEARVVFLPKSVLKSNLVYIQPITNCKNNFGHGIRISSEYRNIIIQLKFPLNGLPPETFEIFYSTGLEFIKIKNKTIDTLNHTISIVQLPIFGANPSAKVSTHFYDYVVGK